MVDENDPTRLVPARISLYGPDRSSWQDRLNFIVEMMRDLSGQSEPEAMVRMYGHRMQQALPTDGIISLSRRDLDRPKVRVTRSTTWSESINPWRERHRLPVFDRGIFSDLAWSGKAVIVDELQLEPNDPAAEYLQGIHSLAACPQFDQGQAVNMVVLLFREPKTFPREALPDWVWMSNLFGRATSNLVVSDRMRLAFAELDRELTTVTDVQRSLLPAKLPDIPGLRLATHYQTSTRAGGDYYDFFALPGVNGEPPGSAKARWGIFLADVSGHGSGAAVLMAVTHAIAHGYPVQPEQPGEFLRFLNLRLCEKYTADTGRFITAWYGVYNPGTRELLYASAGHPEPRYREPDGKIRVIGGERALPMGIEPFEHFAVARCTLETGGSLILYTDGITEARSPDGELYGPNRMDHSLLRCTGDPRCVIDTLLASVDRFTHSPPSPQDDQTIVVAEVVDIGDTTVR